MTDYVTELEKRVDEQQKKLAVYEEVVDIILPLVCQSSTQFSQDTAWLDSIAPRLEHLVGNSDIEYHKNVIKNSAHFMHVCRNAFLECSEKLEPIKNKH